MNQSAVDKDVELLRRISEGDRPAFSQLYDQYGKVLFALAHRILDDQHAAEDVLRDVFSQIQAGAGTRPASLGSPFSWIVTLTRNKAVDYLHAYQNRAKLHAQVAREMLVYNPHSATANDAVRSRLGVEAIAAAVAELPEDQRKAIEIIFFSGLSPSELAETLKEPPAAIAARINVGLAQLRTRLEGVV